MARLSASYFNEISCYFEKCSNSLLVARIKYKALSFNGLASGFKNKNDRLGVLEVINKSE